VCRLSLWRGNYLGIGVGGKVDSSVKKPVRAEVAAELIGVILCKRTRRCTLRQLVKSLYFDCRFSRLKKYHFTGSEARIPVDGNDVSGNGHNQYRRMDVEGRRPHDSNGFTCRTRNRIGPVVTRGRVGTWGIRWSLCWDMSLSRLEILYPFVKFPRANDRHV